MQLRELVERYRQLAGGYGKPVALAAFGWSRKETERIFGIFDEDYHISRFFHFTNAGGEMYQINGFPQTHIALDAEIEGVL
jgi:hypothetical protein